MKNEKAKKLLTLAVAGTMVVGMAGCQGGNKDTAENESADLVWVMQGPGTQSDSDTVWAKVNEDLKKYKGLENVNLEMVVIPGSDYTQKVMLMQTGDEQIDILQTYGLSFKDEVRKNESFIELDDLIDEYAPDIRKEIPDWVMDLTKIDGKQYTIPIYQQMAMPMWGYKFDKANADKYLDQDALQNQMLSSETLNDKTLDMLEDYMLKLKADGKLNLGFKPTETWTHKGYGYINDSINFLYRYDGDNVKVETLLERDVYKTYSKRMVDWYKKGLIRKDVLSAELSQGHYDVQLHQWHKYINSNLNTGVNPGEEVVVLQGDKYFRGQTGSGAGGNGITTSSKHPVAAMKLLDLMNTEKGKDLYRTLVFGIEGTHYDKISDDRIKATGYSTSQDGAYGLNKWIVGNTASAFETESDPEGWNDYVFNDWNANMIPSPIAGIQFDLSAVETEWSQVSSTIAEYNDRLMSGSVEDWDATYKEAMNKMKIAGRDKLIKELQRQVDEFLKTKK